jgi:UDPglucose--hexose-1-phosphate uridylyltransferase
VSEFREDPLHGGGVLLSPARSARPYDFRLGAEERRQKCPFCPGREDRTPPETYAARPGGGPANTPGWQVRAVPNLFAAVPREPADEGSLAFGLHEVIVETPAHAVALADLGAEAILAVFKAWQDRLNAAKRDERLRYACIFENHGEGAGASLEHAHSQILALPFVPPQVERERAAQRAGRFAKLLSEELGSRARAVIDGPAIAAFTPPSARFPYEVWLAPRERQAAFEEAPELTMRAAADALLRLLQTMNARLNEPDYHLVLHTAPFGETGWHWRLELLPRLTRVAGFEWGSGLFINQVSPEESARVYRQELAK